MNIKRISRLFASAALAVSALSFAAPTPAFADSLGNRNILFYSQRDGDNEIYIARPNGNVKQLTTNTGTQDLTPSWRPQGDAFVFASFTPGAGPAQLYRMSLPNKHITQLTNDSTLTHADPTYSPDGTKIAFKTEDASGVTCISTLTVATLAKTVLFCANIGLRESVSQPVWAPNASKILYTGSGLSGFNLFTYDFATQAQTLIVAGGFVGAWSPNFSKLAFSRLRSASNPTEQVFLANPDGTNEQQITSSSPSDPTRSRRFAAWYPDGTKVLILSFAAPDFVAGIRTLTLSNLHEVSLPNNTGIADFATTGAVKQ